MSSTSAAAAEAQIEALSYLTLVHRITASSEKTLLRNVQRKGIEDKRHLA